MEHRSFRTEKMQTKNVPKIFQEKMENISNASGSDSFRNWKRTCCIKSTPWKPFALCCHYDCDQYTSDAKNSKNFRAKNSYKELK